MGYALPSNSDFVSCSWQCHRDRSTPSTEPGTDYGVPYGSPLYAVDNGTVVDIKKTNSYATGRFITIDLDDGRRTRSLHLAEVWVSVGNRVSRGQQIGKTGASGHGSDWGYGAHVHQTLWPSHNYQFGRDSTLDFARYVGDAPVAGNQRTVGPNGANQRPEPKTSSPSSNLLAPGTVGTFDGWIRGESVSGNDVWFRGQFSGLWSWSGGFTDTGTHDLADLNPASIAGNQRKVGPNGANGRVEANTSQPPTQTLAPGTIADFNGWINGETVEGNSVWFRGAHSGDWFWSGGFEDTGTHDLADLNPPAQQTRTVGANSANIRPKPYTSSPASGSAEPGTVVEMSAWAEGENVQGNPVWFQRKEGGWMWSGGFTSQATDGLAQVTPPPPDQAYDEDNPRGLVEYAPVYPRALIGLEAPLGFTDCANPVTRTPRTMGYKPARPTSGIIDRFIIHYTAVTNDQLDWFSWCNPRSVCPTFYLRTDGTVFEMIRPGTKTSATGPDWNWRSIAVESLCVTPGPEGLQTDAQMEEIAQMIAWLAEFDGKELDGAPVDFKIDREHVISHQEALPGTECPGVYIQSRMDEIVARAKVIYAENNPGPDPDPVLVEVPREALEAWRDATSIVSQDIGSYLG
jgi:hypothetical protein